MVNFYAQKDFGIDNAFYLERKLFSVGVDLIDYERL
jgi:hypothetical protein